MKGRQYVLLLCGLAQFKMQARPFLLPHAAQKQHSSRLHRTAMTSLLKRWTSGMQTLQLLRSWNLLALFQLRCRRAGLCRTAGGLCFCPGP